MKPTEQVENGEIPPVAAEAPVTGEKLPDFSFNRSLQTPDDVSSAETVSEAVAVPIGEVTSKNENATDRTDSPEAADSLNEEKRSETEDFLLKEDAPKTETASNIKDSSMDVQNDEKASKEVADPIAGDSLKAGGAHTAEEVSEHVDVLNAKTHCEIEDVMIVEDTSRTKPTSNSKNYSIDVQTPEKASEPVEVPIETFSPKTDDAHSTGKNSEHIAASNAREFGGTGAAPTTENLPEARNATDAEDSSKRDCVPIKEVASNARGDRTPSPEKGLRWRRVFRNSGNVSSAGETSGTGILPTVRSSTRIVKKTNADNVLDDEGASEAGPSTSTANRGRGRPRKRARLTMPKATPKKKKKKMEETMAVVEEEVPDRQAYEVERIISTRLKGRQLFYYMKWKNYPEEENTFEPETRTDCEHLMHDYILDCIDPSDYVNCLQRILTDISHDGYMEFLVIVVPLSAIGLTTVQTGTAKAISHDTVDARLSYLKYVDRHQQQYTLYALKMPNSMQLSEYHKRYLQQLRFRFETFPEHPNVEIVMPRELHGLKGLYPPPPIYTLLFEPVSAEMAEERERHPHMFPPKSEERAYNKSQVFAKEQYFKPMSDTEDPRVNAQLVKRMPRLDFERDPRFAVSFRLHQEAPRGWILSAGHDVKSYTPLMMMTGVIRPHDVAHECLELYGEAVAFSSFIEIPNTGMCLDRRQFYDFSKFIPHSCSPTCSVRLVDSGNDIPDLVVYNVAPLERFNSHSITLDYYKAFTADVKAFFRGLGDSEIDSCPLLEKNIDFVKCQCMSQSCRGVLYVDKSKKRTIKSATKRQKLAALDPDFVFHGSQVADPNKIWTIHNYKFQD